jgi:hypothetical protein
MINSKTQFPVRPQPTKGEVILYLRGGYVIKISKEFTIPVGVVVDLELSQAEQVVKQDWYFNNDEVLEFRVDDSGKKVSITSLAIGDCKVLIRSINLELTITVTGSEAVGFRVETDDNEDVREEIGG